MMSFLAEVSENLPSVYDPLNDNVSKNVCSMY